MNSKPEEILGMAECVCFHMTDVPYGRGGSPLQNLIARGRARTMVSALRMTAEVDAGPVYLKNPLSLEGSAREVYQRLADLVYDMTEEIIATEPQPVPQEGEIVTFTRGTPDQSLLPEAAEIKELYDHIRMLDAETYPRAFIEHGDSRLEFSDASLDGDGVLRARVEFVKTAKGSK